jgi:hypothetical protein
LRNAFKVCQKHDGNDSRVELVEMAVIALAFGMSRFVVLQHTSWRGIRARHGAGVVLFVFVVPLLLIVRCSQA